jgi:hypothetical protein
MALPKAIQRQADEAAAAEAAIANERQTADEVVITDPTQLQPANEQQVSVQPTETPPPPPAEDWAQKYRTLQGMFAQKTGELQAQNKTYASQLAQMQQQLDALMQSRKEEAKEKPQVDPKDIENFGADMVEMVQRYAERVFQSMSDQFGKAAQVLDGRVAALEKAVTGVTTRTEATLEQQFYAALKGAVPDWEQINQDQRWLDWLGETDPVYGVPRQAALDRGREALDAQRVANIFNTFKASLPQKRQDSLANQVAPNGAAAPNPAPQQQTKPVITQKFIEKFYNEYAKGRYAGRDEEANRIIAEIDEAAAQGRIR